MDPGVRLGYPSKMTLCKVAKKENNKKIKAGKEKKRCCKFIGHYHKTPFMFRNIKDETVKSANMH